MQPVVYRLKNKLSWMTTKPRSINRGDEIMTWVSAMHAIHTLLVEATQSADRLERFNTANVVTMKRPQWKHGRRKKLTISTSLGTHYCGDERIVGAKLKGSKVSLDPKKQPKKQENNIPGRIGKNGTERRRRIVRGKRTVIKGTATMSLEQKKVHPPRQEVQELKMLPKAVVNKDLEEMLTDDLDWEAWNKDAHSAVESINEESNLIVEEEVLHSGTIKPTNTSLRCNVGSRETLPDRMRRAMWLRLEEAGKDRAYYSEEPCRFKKLMREVENDLGVEPDELLRDKKCSRMIGINLRDFFSRS